MKQETLYTAASPLAQPARFIRETRADLNAAISIGWQLFLQILFSRYRQSFLGYSWIIIPPLVVTLTAVLLQQANVIHFADNSVSYPVFVLCGSITWQLFSDSLLGMLNIIQSKKSLLTRITFPREALIIVQLIDSHLSLCVLGTITIAVCYFFNIALTGSLILAVAFLSTTIVLGTLIGAILSPLAFLVEDIKRGTQILLSFWFLITPIVYQSTTDSTMGKLAQYNPLSPLVIASRNAVIDPSATVSHSALIVLAATFILSFLGWLCFRITAPIALERAGTVS